MSINQNLQLQARHIFLGAGARTAFLVFYGCNATTTTFQITSKYYSTFEIPECEFLESDRMYVDLFYGLPNEPKNFKRRYFFEKKQDLSQAALARL